jgi:ParB-like chromosome segregation protein Spo0J
MTASAIKVTILVGEFKLDAYQLNLDGETHLLFTHRQIGEIVGKTKATAQNFLKKQAADLPEPIKGIIPSRKGTIALTPWQGAVVYWQSQAETGNSKASALVTAI